jgi:L-ascorbate metabolism protein UlaG (beta-lactamase superfamily)
MMKRRNILKLAGLGAASLTASAFAPLNGNPYYQGPVSDHFDGTRFFNPGRPWNKSRLDLLRWQMSSEGKEAWPETVPSPFSDRPPSRVDGSSARISFVGHASHFLQTGGLNILIDPVWSERCSPVSFAGPKRVNPPGIDLADLPRIDVILLTHNHYDHLDIDTIGPLVGRDDPRIVAPLGNDTIVREAVPAARIEVFDWQQDVVLNGKVRVHFVPAQHWSARGLFDRLCALWSSYLIETPAGMIYHVGDTGFNAALFSDTRKKYGTPRLAILPIGAYEPRWFMKDQHINPEEAVEIMRLLGASHALGHHWGTFKLTDEGVMRPPEALELALDAKGIERTRFRPMRPGQAFTLNAGTLRTA